ncbi:DUF4309 domain-containing protein [Aneurinibacillus sp. Ricciae_BoGa-3]|uniref:DUF4309 domain-containing protein n=1 Tax=Aneurinibacillus sp. Ricciae_BoGa-3 TaxID=3022697 RepID=UPI00234057C6|nr:DUF4309 domain-containing protein [Aneurinibacillus sp. Ricciae_BoGa-3]WCK54897.1 DUF4309 domain-containing protein [Aneurinibacillus sp. Ricciae_BoGa-3]
MKIPARFIFSASLVAGSIFSSVTFTATQAMAASVVQAPTAQQSASSEQFLQQTRQLASKGKVSNSEFGLGTNKSVILKKWGQPDYQDTWTISYTNRGVIFDIDPQSGVVNAIISRDPKIKKIPTSAVKKALGSPAYADHGMGHVNLVYDNTGTGVGKNEIIYHGASGSPEAGYNLSYIQLSKK